MLTKYQLFTESLFNKEHKSGQKYSWADVKNIDFPTEPTTLEGMIKFLIKWYPTLHHGVNARERALECLFLTIGGGYAWVDDGRRLNRHVGYETDAGMIENRRRVYDLDDRNKRRKDDIKSLKQDLVYCNNNLTESEEELENAKKYGDNNIISTFSKSIKYYQSKLFRN